MRYYDSGDREYFQQLEGLIHDQTDRRAKTGYIVDASSGLANIRLGESGTVMRGVPVVGGTENVALGDKVYLTYYGNQALALATRNYGAGGTSAGGTAFDPSLYYTRQTVDSLLAAKAPWPHTHNGLMPGTLTWATINEITTGGVHTHEIITTYNGMTSPNYILRTDYTGSLILNDLDLQGSNLNNTVGELIATAAPTMPQIVDNQATPPWGGIVLDAGNTTVEAGGDAFAYWPPRGAVIIPQPRFHSVGAGVGFNSSTMATLLIEGPPVTDGSNPNDYIDEYEALGGTTLYSRNGYVMVEQGGLRLYETYNTLHTDANLDISYRENGDRSTHWDSHIGRPAIRIDKYWAPQSGYWSNSYWAASIDSSTTLYGIAGKLHSSYGEMLYVSGYQSGVHRSVGSLVTVYAYGDEASVVSNGTTAKGWAYAYDGSATLANTMGGDGVVGMQLDMNATSTGGTVGFMKGLELRFYYTGAGSVLTAGYGVIVNDGLRGATSYGLYLDRHAPHNDSTRVGLYVGGESTYAIHVDDGITRLDGDLETIAAAWRVGKNATQLNLASNEISLGASEEDTPADVVLRGPRPKLPDTSGADLYIDAAPGRGTGTSGDIIFRTHAAGAGGTDTITFDTASETAFNLTADGWYKDVRSVDHTVADQPNRLLVVGVALTGARIVRGVTYSGQALTKLEGAGVSTARAELWYLKNPRPGTHTLAIVCGIAGSDVGAIGYGNYAVGVESYYGVDLTNPFGTPATATGTGSTSSVTAASVSGDVVIDVVAKINRTEGLTVDPSQTERVQVNSESNTAASDYYLGMSEETATGTSTAMNWSWATSRAWAGVAVALKAAADGTLGTMTEVLRLTPNGVQIGNSNVGASAAEIVLDGGGSELTTGVKLDFEMPYSATLEAWTLLADQSGSITIDLWRDSYGNYPPTDADSLTNGHEPTISSGVKAQDTDLSDWTSTTLSEGDIVRINIDSVTTLTRAVLSLKFRRT